MNQNNNINTSSSSCFVNYIDYTNTSSTNYNDVFKMIVVNNIVDMIDLDIPNTDTMQAISEARSHMSLKNYNNISDFFDDLEQ